MSPTPTIPTTPNERQFEQPLDLEEEVRRRAYELYEQRGKEEGHDLEDWLQAESELVQKRAKAATG
jgi:hypothetical protein